MRVVKMQGSDRGELGNNQMVSNKAIVTVFFFFFKKAPTPLDITKSFIQRGEEDKIE